MTDQSATTLSSSSSKVPRGFPLKLHHMIEEAYKNGQEDLICWLPCGTQFRIGNQKELAETLISKYCRHKNYKSFLRQLSMYKFQRCLSIQGPNKNVYYHPHFLRHRLDLTAFINRACIKDIPKSLIYPASNDTVIDPQKYVAAAANLIASVEEDDRMGEESQPILTGATIRPSYSKLDKIKFSFSDVPMDSHILPASTCAVVELSPLVVSSQPLAMPLFKDIVDEIIYTFRGDYTRPEFEPNPLSVSEKQCLNTDGYSTKVY